MNREYELTAQASGQRLDKYLAEEMADLSRSRIKELVQAGEVLVNGKKSKVSYKVQKGDLIQVTVLPLEPLALEAENIPLDIVYEDEDVIVVNKPQGMVVHPAAGHPSHTLVNALLYHTRDLADSPEGFRPGIVHRIDKDTSGLLMVAKNAAARESLEKQLAAKSNKRQYLAIVHGNFAEEEGTIDAPIGRNPKDRKQMAVVEKGKSAVTHFRVLEQYQGYSLVECQLETGRTHQIRVHMTYIGHPLVGDPKYCPQKTCFSINGQALHSEQLTFRHPRTGEWMTFRAPVPEDMQTILTRLRHGQFH